MISPVNITPPVSRPVGFSSITGISAFFTTFYSTLMNTFLTYGIAINALINFQTAPTGPIILATYVKTALPSASANTDGVIIVSNDVGGLTIAYSDGTNWRRVQDRNIIS
jgi:hypothetical protein